MDSVYHYLLIWSAVTIPAVVLGWCWLFPKAGQPWWYAVVPGFNLYILVMEIAQLSWIWFILVLLPPFQLIAAILVNLEVAKRFGRSEAFGLGLSVFGWVFYPVLAFGPAKYQK